MGLYNTIDKYKSQRLVIYLYQLVKIGMGLTFIISGTRKLPGVHFTILPLDNPVGAFFHAMYDSGIFWHSIGYFQIIVGLLIFFRKTTVLAALLMMPVTWNIFMVSISLHMAGTPVITSAMVLGNVFLLLFNYQNYRLILERPIT